MLLTWDRGYEDYDDPKWETRLKNLASAWEMRPPVQAMDGDQMLDCLESAEEMMRYYTAVKDFQRLEKVMRAFGPMLQAAEEKCAGEAGLWYLMMEYERVNALLYLDQGSARRAAEHFERALEAEKKCFDRVCGGKGITGRAQEAYLLWACAECLDETARVCDRIMDEGRLHRVLTECVPVADMLLTRLEDEDGIRERTAAIYARIGASCFRHGDPLAGMRHDGNAVRLYDKLAKKCRSDYYAAMSLWFRCLEGLDVFAYMGSDKPITDCERALDSFLEKEGLSDLARAVAEGASGMAVMRRADGYGAAGDAGRATALMENAHQMLARAEKTLEDEIISASGGFKALLTPVAAGLFTGVLASGEALGLMYFKNEETEKAKTLLGEVLRRAADVRRYSLSEIFLVNLQAACCQYLAVISCQENDMDRMVFYASQALDISEDAGHRTRRAALLETAAVSAGLLAEYAHTIRDRNTAQEYAIRGLKACDALAQADPASEALKIRNRMEKWSRGKKRLRLFG